jgi:SAM domain (Sterile alpha motif)
VTTLTDWLGSLGLSEYAGRFAENGIDISVLPDLTDQDLKDIGFYSVIAGSCCARSMSFPAPAPPRFRPQPRPSQTKGRMPSDARS